MLNIFTIVHQGMPYLTQHITTFNRLSMPWRWTIAHGPADNVKDTSWCKTPKRGLSTDGTTEYLFQLTSSHPRVSVIHNSLWDGKVDMCNACLTNAQDGVLMQVDVDEFFLPAQIELVYRRLMMNQDGKTWAKFWCRYFLGQNIVTVKRNAYGNNGVYEWARFWKFKAGMKWLAHEPPILVEANGITPFHPANCYQNDETESWGCVFDHYAYALESQVRFKEVYYGYTNAVEQWRGLQAETQFPCLVSKHLKWVTDGALCDKLHK